MRDILVILWIPMDSKTILKDLKNLLISRYGNDIKRVILFGSQAVGDAEKFSDFDILIVLEEDYDWRREKELIALCYDIDLKYDIITDIKLISENDLKTIKGKQQYILQALESGITV